MDVSALQDQKFKVRALIEPSTQHHGTRQQCRQLGLKLDRQYQIIRSKEKKIHIRGKILITFKILLLEFQFLIRGSVRVDKL